MALPGISGRGKERSANYSSGCAETATGKSGWKERLCYHSSKALDQRDVPFKGEGHCREFLLSDVVPFIVINLD